MKKKRFRTKIILSYSFLIFFFGILLTSVNYVLTLRSLEKQTKAGLNSVKVLASVNSRLLDVHMKPLQARLVLQKTRALAYKLSQLLRDIGESNLKQPIRDKRLTEILDAAIYDNFEKVMRRTGSISILNDSGTILYNSDNILVGKNYKSLKGENLKIYNLVNRAFKKEEDHGYYKHKTPDNLQVEIYFASEKVPNANLFLFYVSNIKTISTEIQTIISNAEKHELGFLTEKVEDSYVEVAIAMGIFFPIILLTFIVLSVFFGAKLANKISKPLEELQEGVERIGQGNFNVKVDEKAGAMEVVRLATSFNKLGLDLQDYIKKLEEEIEARKIIESEMKIAQKIQKSVLPKFTEDFKGQSFALHAKLKPAKNIAGDFFDFFFLDKEKTKLVFLVADVSGKGVPAAFFMGIVKTLIKQIFLSDASKKPHEVLAATNNHLFIGNKEFMFVTMFLVQYDLKTGYLTYANAGHHQGTKLKLDGTMEKFGELSSTVLGFAENTEYVSGQEYIKIGERLVLYTDGITEAVSGEGAFYGEERLEKALGKNSKLSLTAICENIIDDVCTFQNHELADDISMLIFERLK